MTIGPIETLVIEYQAEAFKSTIIPMLTELVEHGFLHVHDIVFISRDQSGKVRVAELSDVGPEISAALDPIVDEISGLISSEDVEQVAVQLKADTTATILLVEHVWSETLREAVEESSGKLIIHERIPNERVLEAIRQADQD